MLLSRLHVAITGENRSAKRALEEVDRAALKTAATLKAAGSASYSAMNSIGNGAAKWSTGIAAATIVTSSFATVLAGIGGGASVAVLGGLTTAALALGSGFVVAGVGVAAFAALAAPTFQKVADGSKAYTKALEDQAAAEKLTDPVARAKALEKAALDQEAALAALNGGQQAVVIHLAQLRKEWHATADELSPVTFELMHTGINTLRGALPLLLPVAQDVGEAFAVLGEKVRGGLTGDRMQAFLAQVQATAPALIGQVGEMGFNLAGALANGVTAGQPLIAQAFQSMVNATGGLEDMFASEGFREFVAFGTRMLPELGELFSSLGGAVAALGRGFAPIAGVAVDALTSLADSLQEAFSGAGMERFAATVVELLPMVADVLRAVGGVAGALGSALAPAVPVLLGALQTLGAGLEDVLGGPEATALVGALMDGFVAVVPVLTSVATGILNIAQAVINTLVPLMPGLVGPVEQVAQVLADVLAQFAPIVLGFAQPFANLATAVGQVVVATGPLLHTFVQGLFPVMEALGAALIESIPAWQDLTQEVVAAFPAFAEFLVVLVGALPQLMSLAAVIASELLPAFVDLLEVGTAVVGWLREHETLAGTVIVTLGGLAAATMAISGAVGVYNSVAAAVTTLIAVKKALGLAYVWTGIQVLTARGALTAWQTSLVASVATTRAAFAAKVTAARLWLASTATAIGGAIAAAWGWVGAQATVVASTVAGWATSAAAAVAGAATIVAGWVAAGAAALASAAAAALAWAAFLGPIALVVAAVAGVAYLIYRNWDAIVSATKTAWDAVAGFVTDAVAWVTDLFMQWHPVGIIIRNWDQIVEAFRNGRDRVVGFVQGIPDRVQDLFSNAGDWLIDAGRALINGFVDGIQQVASAPYNAVRDLLGAVGDLFPHSPAKEGPFSGKGYTTHSGTALVEDFEGSIAHALPSVQATLARGLSDVQAQFTTTGAPGTRQTAQAPLPTVPSSGQTVHIGSLTIQGGGTADENVAAFQKLLGDVTARGLTTVRQTTGRG